MQDAIRFSPDGHTLAGAVLNRKVTVGPSAVSSNTEGYAIVLWDTGTGEVKTTIDAFATGVECIAFSQDGSLLASGGGHHWKKGARCERCELRIWDTRSGKLSLNLAGHGDLPDGKYLRTGYGISHLVSDDGSMVRAPGKHSGVVGVVAFSPDGRLLMSSSGGETKLWDTRDGSLIHTIPARNLGTRCWSASCACFSPDSRTLAIGGTWSKILLIDTAAGAVDTSLAELDIASCHISALIFSPDGNTLVSGDSSGTVRLWDWKLTWAVKDGPRRGDHR